MSHLLRASLQNTWDFPGGPAVETPGFQRRGTQFLVKELRSHIQCGQKKEKEPHSKVEVFKHFCSQLTFLSKELKSSALPHLF